MKKIILIFILLSNFLWGLELTKLETNWLREHPVIRIAPDPDFPPIEWIDENGEYKGIAKDYIDIISGKLNIKFETVQCKNWEQVLKKAQNHEVDMLPAGAQTPQRAKYMNFSTPHIIFPGVFITGNEHADITSINELYGKKIVCVSGYVWQDMFNLHHPEIEIVSVPNLQTGLRKVAMGENDVLIATLPIALYYIEKEGISNLRVAGESGFFTKLSILTRKDWPLLGTIMEKAVLSIDAETKKKILNKWVKIDRPTIFVSRKFQNILIGIILLSGIIIIAIYSWNRALKKLVVKRAAEVENVMEKRLKVEQELVVAGKQWHQIIDSTEDAIWILDLDHRILQSNKAAEKLFHISHNKIINQFCYPLVHKTTEPIEDCPFLRMKKSLKKEAMEMQTDFGWHYITTDPLLDDKGRLIGAVHIVRDITERKKIEKLNKHNLEKKIIFYIASFILFAAIIVAILIIVGGEKNLISREQKQL
ncbi:MAG: transporter substrate-binding domain-containing protein, partial [Candidatus Cloacimonetes bacterium]|nr:transporter substrate-binding domain-containing protein [Candidatus Cloacimonadota bacterium]